MRAIVSRAVGGPESLELAEVDDPVAKKGEVVIAVAACGVNFPDSLIIEDKYQFKPARPFSPGGEVAGVVESVGEGVSRAGDRPARARLDRAGAAWRKKWSARSAASCRFPTPCRSRRPPLS